jgi:hypothetical protein
VSPLLLRFVTVETSLAAGRDALDRAAWVEARGWLERAGRLLERLPPMP